MKKLVFVVLFVLQSSVVFGADTMNQNILETVVKNISQNARGEKGFVEFVFNDVKMYLISDVSHDRMRIISAISEYKDVTKEQLDAMMVSNFHTSLDARYGVSNGILYSAYIHPLSSLSEEQIRSAVTQVANLSLSFGSEYSSGLLHYKKEETKETRETKKAIDT